jgi:hypothetical protein
MLLVQIANKMGSQKKILIFVVLSRIGCKDIRFGGAISLSLSLSYIILLRYSLLIAHDVII